MELDSYVQWVKDHVGCEVYLIHDPNVVNGFVEYRNQRHIIYILGDKQKMDLTTYLDILAHEAGHVIYNARKMAEGWGYEEIVQKTAAKLSGIDSLLREQVISDTEYDRFYASMEEEWESNREKERILEMWFGAKEGNFVEFRNEE